MTPRERALATCHCEEDERVLKLVARAVEEDRQRGGAFDAREMELLVECLDRATSEPHYGGWCCEAGPRPIPHQLRGNAVAEGRELLFRLRGMATRAGT